MLTVPHEWDTLTYYDPAVVLRNIRPVELMMAHSNLRKEAKTLRTHELRRFGERRQAAIFSYLIGRFAGLDVQFAHFEAADHDAIVQWRDNDTINYVPLQLKELVPEDLSPQQTIDLVIEGLSETYPRSGDLVVAVFLNRRGQLDLESFPIPDLTIKELWFFGAAAPDGSQWFICGDILANDRGCRVFPYPGT